VNHPRRQWTRNLLVPSRVALAAFVILIVLTSLTGPGWNTWPEMVAELRAGATLALHKPVLITLLERLLTFLPLGVLVHRELARSWIRRPRLVAWWAIVLFALAIELAQAPVAGRHARLSDLIVAAACGTAGIVISDWLGEPPVAPARLRALLLALLVVGNAIVSFAIVHSRRGAELRGWDCGYPLVVANELSADRPWLGRLRGLSIYARALSQQQVVALRDLPFSGAGAAVRARLGGLASFDFSKAKAGRVAQLLPGGAHANLVLPPPDSSTWQTLDHALEVRRPLLIAASAGSGRICEAIMRSREFAVEAVIASATPDQVGPARIVSQSIDPYLRNFTLGQERTALVFRVRTPWTGPNGALDALWAEGALSDPDWHHVVATYAGGVATLFLDGRRLSTVKYYELMPLSEIHVVRLAAFAALGFVVMGLIAARLKAGASWRSTLGHAYLGAALVPVSVTLLLALQSEHALDWPLFAAAAFGPALGVVALRSWSWLRERLAWRPYASTGAAAEPACAPPSPPPARPPARQ